METLGALTPLLTFIFAIVLFMILELFPVIRPWWDKVPPEKKRAYRGWVGLLIDIALGLLHYFNIFDLKLGPTVTPQGILILLVSWVLFVQGSETIYQTFHELLPRKVAERNKSKATSFWDPGTSFHPTCCEDDPK